MALRLRLVWPLLPCAAARFANNGPLGRADHRAGALAPPVFRSRGVSAGSVHPHRRSRGVGVEPRPPLGVRQAAGGAEPGPGRRPAWHDAAALPGVLQADHELPRARRRQPHPALGRGLRPPPHGRAFLDDAARRRARLERRGAGRRRCPSGGGMRPGSPPARACSTAGPSTRRPIRRIEAACGAWIARNLAGLHRHPQPRDHRRHHHRGASAALRPVAGPLRRRLDRGLRRPLPRPGLALCRRRPPRRLQHRAVRTLGPALSPSPAGAGAGGGGHAGGVERADHLPRGQGPGAPFHAPRRLPGGDRQCLRPGDRGRRHARCCANISWARSPPSTSSAPDSL